MKKKMMMMMKDGVMEMRCVECSQNIQEQRTAHKYAHRQDSACCCACCRCCSSVHSQVVECGSAMHIPVGYAPPFVVFLFSLNFLSAL